MAPAQAEKPFDLDAYLSWEDSQNDRHEYLAGKVFAMSGGSDAHYTITLNAAAALKKHLARRLRPRPLNLPPKVKSPR